MQNIGIKEDSFNDYLITLRRMGDDSETPIPELPIKSISTKLLLFLKYCPIITVALSRSMPIPIAENQFILFMLVCKYVNKKAT